MSRLLALVTLLLSVGSAFGDEPAALPAYPVVHPGETLQFPVDHGAHPAFRTEWWYVTGWLRANDGRQFGFQVTFFRTRPAIDQRNPSAFAPQQLLFAHAALSDPSLGHLLHDQRVARAGFGLAEAATGDADLVLADWSLRRGADGLFRTRIKAGGFAFDLTLDPTQPVLLQGEDGYSRKGPSPDEASYYYSLPHLAVRGVLTQRSVDLPVTGQAWLDREWSSTLLDPRAIGWDWLGANLDDGSALTVFQIRDAAGQPLWAGGSLRAADGSLIQLHPQDVTFRTDKTWQSPRTGTRYPVGRSVSVTIAGQARQWQIRPLFDDQELDSREAGGPVYWEGAVVLDGGRGYLELTGYMDPLKM